MLQTGLVDVLMVLEYAVQKLRNMMNETRECESFATMLGNLDLLGCNAEETMKGLLCIRISDDVKTPHPHIWNVVCLAACIFRMASFLREADPREVLVVDDMLFHRGTMIRLPSIGETRMIVTMGIFYHAVCKKMGTAAAAIDLYKTKDTCHLLHMVYPFFESAVSVIKKPSTRKWILQSWIECNNAFSMQATSEEFIDDFRTIDRLTGSVFAFVFALNCVEVKASPVLATKAKDIIGCLKFCMGSYKPPAGAVHRFHLHGTKKDALFDIVSFELQDLGKLNAMIQSIIKRAGGPSDEIQKRAIELLVSLKNKS